MAKSFFWLQAIISLLFQRVMNNKLEENISTLHEHYSNYNCKRSLVNKELRVNSLTEVPLIIVGTFVFISRVFISVYQGVQFISCSQYYIHGFKVSTLHDR